MEIILLPILLMIVQQSSGKFACNEDGDYEHPHSCYRYYTCKNGIEIARKCMGRMHWKSTGYGEGKCTLPSSHSCLKRRHDLNYDETHVKPVYSHAKGMQNDDASNQPNHSDKLYNKPYEHNPTNQRKSTFDCSGANGHYGDPSDCGRFFLCIDGKKFGYTCPMGMHFSTLGYCDYIHNANCYSVDDDIYSLKKDGSGDLSLSSIIEVEGFSGTFSGDLNVVIGSGYVHYANVENSGEVNEDQYKQEELITLTNSKT